MSVNRLRVQFEGGVEPLSLVSELTASWSKLAARVRGKRPASWDYQLPGGHPCRCVRIRAGAERCRNRCTITRPSGWKRTLQHDVRSLPFPYLLTCIGAVAASSVCASSRLVGCQIGFEPMRALRVSTARTLQMQGFLTPIRGDTHVIHFWPEQSSKLA
jgi:hypothetical protein